MMGKHICIHVCTIYTVYLASNKFGKMGHNAPLLTFKFGEQDDIKSTLFIIHMYK